MTFFNSKPLGSTFLWCSYILTDRSNKVRAKFKRKLAELPSRDIAPRQKTTPYLLMHFIKNEVWTCHRIKFSFGCFLKSFLLHLRKGYGRVFFGGIFLGGIFLRRIHRGEFLLRGFSAGEFDEGEFSADRTPLKSTWLIIIFPDYTLLLSLLWRHSIQNLEKN